MMRISRRLSRAIRKEPREFNYTSFSSGRGKKKQNEISPDINTSPRAQREEKSTTRSFSYLCHRHVWAVLVLGILRVAVHRSIRHFYCLSLSLSLSLSLCVCVSYKITHGERTKVRESAKTDVVHLVLVVCVLLVSSRARCKVMNSLENSSFFSPL